MPAWRTPLMQLDLEREIASVILFFFGTGSCSPFQQACGRTGNVIAFNWRLPCGNKSVSSTVARLCCDFFFSLAHSTSGVRVCPPHPFYLFIFLTAACCKVLAGAVTLQEFHSRKGQNLWWPSELPYQTYDPYASCAHVSLCKTNKSNHG